MIKEPKRNPNCNCDLCYTPIYRRPNLLKKNKNKFCSHICQMKFIHNDKELSNYYLRNAKLPVMFGSENPSWKGGVTYFKKKGNYKNIKYLKCPIEFRKMARKDGYVMEHRLIMAKLIKRPLNRNEVVHHIDHNPNNNNIENLLLFPNNSSHKRYEALENSKYYDIDIWFNNLSNILY